MNTNIIIIIIIINIIFITYVLIFSEQIYLVGKHLVI